jgi:hypothetical protein
LASWSDIFIDIDVSCQFGDAPKPAAFFIIELFHSYHFDDVVIQFIILS